MSLARLLYELFFEGCTHYAEAEIDEHGKLAYKPRKGIPSLKLIQEHIDGLRVLGAYTVLPGNLVRWMAFDIDSKLGLEEARKLATRLCRLMDAQKYILEYSGNKGYHVILIFDEPVPAKDAKELGDAVHAALGFAKRGDCHVEVFPKQGELKEIKEKGETKRELGNLLRLPLGKHPKTENKAIFVSIDDWVTPLDPEKELSTKRATLDDLKKLLKDEDPKEKVMAVVLPYWTEGQRHDIALYTSGALANLGWTEEDVASLVEMVHENGGSGELRDQLNTVKTTFKRYYDGESVRGIGGLSEIMSSKSVADFVEAASKQTTTPIMQMIDRYRLEKDAAFKKVRKSAAAIINYFKEHGKLVTDGEDIYWLDRRSRDLMLLLGKAWIRFAHNEFGLNTAESFGKQVLESIQHQAAEAATLVKVHRRTFWDKIKKLLYLNLGGSEVYVLNGNPKERRVIMNGDEDVLFLNSQDSLYVPNLMEDDESSVLDVWDYLANDLNFKLGDEVQATPAQQREMFKACLVSMFFPEVLATRPILSILAEAASGKTTALRRFLKLIEGPDEEVLGAVPDKPDSFRSSLEQHIFLVLDNLEKTNAPWLPDMLNRVSTGTHIEIRKLHTTNENYKIRPNVFVGLTAISMPFSDEAVYTRMLPIELAPLPEYKSEVEIQAFLVDNLNGLWKGMLDCLDQVVAELAQNDLVDMPAQTRLADFAIFCARIKNAPFLDGKELIAGLENLVNRQKKVLEENSPLVDVIKIWVEARRDESETFFSVSQLFTFWQRVANMNRLEWHFRTAQGLSKHMEMLKPQLVQHYGMSTRNFREGGREIQKYKFERKQIRAH